MKAITIHQPWATLIALGEKRFETRSWATKYRGKIAIHAGKKFDKDAWLEPESPGFLLPEDYPTGAVIAVADLVECWEVIGESDVPELGTRILRDSSGSRMFGITQGTKEFMFGDYTVGRYAWELTNVRQIDPIPAKGQQRLWNWDGNGY